LLSILLLASCAAPRLRPDASMLAAQAERERVLSAQPRWSLAGRLAISGPQDGGSGSLTWTQDGAKYRFAVSAPVTGKTWTLSGNGEQAELSGLREQAIVGHDAASLLRRELGWNVPVLELSSWVRGLRAPGPAGIVFRSDGLPAEFAQDGWKIEYRDYDTSHAPALPRRVFASNGVYKVRLAIQRWETP
jgi:outer membrane lipoprotein LolB